MEVTFSSAAGSKTDGLPVLRPRLPCDRWAGCWLDLLWGLDGRVVLPHRGVDGERLVDGKLNCSGGMCGSAKDSRLR